MAEKWTLRYPDDFEWILYVRISDDREGAGLGVKRQEKDGRSLIDRLGGRVLVVCVDNDLTANDRSGRYKPRPDYNRMCELLREQPGRRGVVAWHSDRLHRTPRELEDFIDLIESVGAPVETYKAGTVDLSTPSGRMIARQLCAVARYESEHKSDRIRAKVQELADAGKIANGGPRPFGYRRIYAGEGNRRKIIRDEIDPVEAEVVRECARRALAGESLRSIVDWLNNERQIRSSTGKYWRQQSLRFFLRSGRIAGLREHHRQVVGPAVWPAIISREQHEQLRALLDFRTQAPGNNLRKYYPSGYVYCSDCVARGVKMRTGTRAQGGALYRCPPKLEGGCGSRVVQMKGLLTMLRRYLVRRASDPAVLRELAQIEDVADDRAAVLSEQIDSDERRLKLLESALDDGDEEELPEVLASVRRVRRRIREAREEMGKLAGMSSSVAMLLPDLDERWESMTVAQHRLVLDALVERILIKPAVRGRGYFDPDRVEIVPRGRR